jgi:hypothetical protein
MAEKTECKFEDILMEKFALPFTYYPDISLMFDLMFTHSCPFLSPLTTAGLLFCALARPSCSPSEPVRPHSGPRDEAPLGEDHQVSRLCLERGAGRMSALALCSAAARRSAARRSGRRERRSRSRRRRREPENEREEAAHGGWLERERKGPLS